ncbi:Homoserine kinase [Paenibacillus auburnensis]|uniref:Homoserine kinase n=1 Tax=Paenibacillus auburnensis TaxID=2905649 RepID=A0ABN8GAB6_9BACL|nr:phosphotransferase [Paenibacillus auburnensis]CAH1204316.1 Homoserine kinase [Paenibacillus auburnensis]
MLKLKYLFNNEELAEMVLRNWAYDRESLHLFQYYRISSNAIYPFENGGNNLLLRFAPQTEKLRSNLLAELEFISYLRERGYGVLETVPSREGSELVEAQTPWGSYYASVFKRVAGVSMDTTSLDDQTVFRYGQALGELHRLSSEYSPVQGKRWTHNEVLEWIRRVLEPFPEQTAARAETELLADYFGTIPVTLANYGLIHYDFELDNVFYDQTQDTINVIDFDDSMYHWYAVDIEQALDSLLEAVATEEQGPRKERFLEGYTSRYDLPEEGPSQEACRRFADLYRYARILRSTAEQWEHEPEWLTGLRSRLQLKMKAAASRFGLDISV